MFIPALLPRVSTADGVDVAICAPFTALQARRRLHARLARRRSTPRTCTRPPQGAFTGEISAPMLDRARRPRRRPRPLRAARAVRRDRPRARRRRSRPRSPPGCMPILCVGETEDERERGETERKLRHQVQEGLAKVAARAAAARSSIAYEPIWAIGTGKVATPEQAQEAMRASSARWSPTATREAGAARRGSSTAASVKPDNAAELLALPDVDGALVGGASLESRTRSPRSSRRRARVTVAGAVGGASSSSTAGGSRRPGPGNAVELADTPVFDALWARYPHTQLTACGRAVGLPEGQMGNSEVGHLNLGAGAGRPPGPDADRRRGRGRRARRERGAARRDARRRRACT